jgi:hypothetical protein
MPLVDLYFEYYDKLPDYNEKHNQAILYLAAKK